MEDYKKKLKLDFIRGMKMNYMIWPFVQIFNFALVPLHYRLLVVNMSVFFCLNHEMVSDLCGKMLIF